MGGAIKMTELLNKLFNRSTAAKGAKIGGETSKERKNRINAFNKKRKVDRLLRKAHKVIFMDNGFVDKHGHWIDKDKHETGTALVSSYFDVYPNHTKPTGVVFALNDGKETKVKLSESQMNRLLKKNDSAT